MCGFYWNFYLLNWLIIHDEFTVTVVKFRGALQGGYQSRAWSFCRGFFCVQWNRTWTINVTKAAVTVRMELEI